MVETLPSVFVKSLLGRYLNSNPTLSEKSHGLLKTALLLIHCTGVALALDCILLMYSSFMFWTGIVFWFCFQVLYSSVLYWSCILGLKFSVVF